MEVMKHCSVHVRKRSAERHYMLVGLRRSLANVLSEKFVYKVAQPCRGSDPRRQPM
jgi:hypothetical protein